VKLYYMRDNHTFRNLPLDSDQAVAALREEFRCGYTHGMLCWSSENPRSLGNLHAAGNDTAEEFFDEARDWIKAAIEENDWWNQLSSPDRR